AAFEGRILHGGGFPRPSRPRSGEEIVTVPVETATKAALHLVVAEARESKSQLARRMNVDEKEVRRLMDPTHSSKVQRVAAAVAAYGRRIRITIVEAEKA